MKRFAAVLLLTVTVFCVSVPARGWDGERRSQLSGSDCDDDGCCSGDGCCSPFYACGSCHGFEPVAQTAIALAPTARTTIPVPRAQPYFIVFYEDIWQPPEFAEVKKQIFEVEK
jgi:hypothetical protein